MISASAAALACTPARADGLAAAARIERGVRSFRAR